jgi:DNA-binding HxlR family transcriptional regulator
LIKPPLGPFAAECPTRELLDQLADKWAVLALVAIADEPMRFNALRRLLEGVSQKVLTQTLRRLERNGLVARTVIASVPVAVSYSITPLGRSLEKTVENLRRWSMDHIHHVQRSRARYDKAS